MRSLIGQNDKYIARICGHKVTTCRDHKVNSALNLLGINFKARAKLLRQIRSGFVTILTASRYLVIVVFEHYFRKKIHACRGELPWKIAETRGNPVANKRSIYQRAENKVIKVVRSNSTPISDRSLILDHHPIQDSPKSTLASLSSLCDARKT